jgi:hypothetical protein
MCRLTAVAGGAVSQNEEEPERYLVILAVRPLAYWTAVEVWLNKGEVETVNGLGEGLPLEDTDWPWPEGDNEDEEWL